MPYFRAQHFRTQRGHASLEAERHGAGKELNTRNDQGKLWVAGGAYEPYGGRWSGLVAAEFLEGPGVPVGVRWLDIGCGTGTLSGAILDRCAPASVLGVRDVAEGDARPPPGSRVSALAQWSS